MNEPLSMAILNNPGLILNSLLSQMRTVGANVGKYSSTMEHMGMENGPGRKFVDFPSYKMVMFFDVFCMFCVIYRT